MLEILKKIISDFQDVGMVSEEWGKDLNLFWLLALFS